MRALAFLPIYLFCILFLITKTQSGVLYEMSGFVGKIAKGSLDFFFFLSAFLITSHGLREYKYLDSFSLKNFLVRRLLRVISVLVFVLIFTFFVHPWLVDILDLKSKLILVPSIEPYLILVPNYFSTFGGDQLIYLTITCSIYMFIQYYIVWGIVLKYLRNQLLIVSLIAVVVGIVSRIIHVMNDSDFTLDTLAYGVPIGLGAIVAQSVRNEDRIVEHIKEFSKNTNSILYLFGVVLLLSGYIIANGTFLEAFIPILLCLFFGFVIVEQTFGKNSFVQLKSRKILTYLGKISYGLILYQAIIGVLVMLAVESLDFDLSSFYIIGLIIVAGFIGAVVVADISYKLFEKPLLRIRRAFKKV